MKNPSETEAQGFLQSSPSKRGLGLAMAFLTAGSWSVLAIFLKVALDFGSATTIVWMRFSVAFSLLTFFLFIISLKKSETISAFEILKKPPLLAILSGVFLAINYMGYMKGVEYTSPSNAQIVIQLSPMLLILSGVFIFKERPSPRQWLGILLAFTGLGLFFRDQHGFSFDSLDQFYSGNAWIVVGAIGWAAYTSFQKILTKSWNPSEINLVVFLVATVLIFPFSQLSEALTWSPLTWLLMTYLGVNTIIAYGALGLALKHAPASQVSVIITFNPILTLVFMKILEWQEVTWIEPDQVSLLGYLGAATVVLGVILAVLPKGQV